MKPFPGFPADLFHFLTALKHNNHREWFTANRERYQTSVVEPMCEFISAMAPRLANISEYCVADARPHGGSMFRIYRDTRFSKDKRPYKENVGCQFRHRAGQDAHTVGFYLHLEPEEVFFGGGIWTPPNPVLDQIRRAIVEKPERWAAVLENPTFVKRFGGITGDGLKRPPQGYDPHHPYIEDLKRKTFFAIQEVDPSLARTPHFIDEVEEAFAATRPLMKFISTALGLPW